MSVDRLELSGARLSMTSLNDVYDGLDPELCRPKAIRVSGLSSDTKKDYLSLIFESERRTGGGEIVDLEYDVEDGIAVITFKDANSELCVITLNTCIILGLIKVKACH